MPLADHNWHLSAIIYDAVYTNTESGVEFPTVTNDTGAYRVDYLQPGSYKLTVSLPGFKTVN